MHEILPLVDPLCLFLAPDVQRADGNELAIYNPTPPRKPTPPTSPPCKTAKPLSRSTHTKQPTHGQLFAFDIIFLYKLLERFVDRPTDRQQHNFR